MTPQNYYKTRKQRQIRTVDTEFIIAFVHQIRSEHPRMGGRKLLILLDESLNQSGIQIGRDRFFDILRAQDLLVPRKRRSARTTNSYHTLPIFSNLLKDTPLSGPNQAYVSDITYIRVRESFIYLSLITDAWSRKIVGWHAGDTLEAIGCLNALEMALDGLGVAHKPIHHSDRGCQYCCHAYVNRLKEAGFRISMTEENHCYENGLAERVNGILKDEYNLVSRFLSKRQAIKAISQAIHLYNTKRPHLSLGYRIPEEVHSVSANRASLRSVRQPYGLTDSAPRRAVSQ